MAKSAERTIQTLFRKGRDMFEKTLDRAWVEIFSVIFLYMPNRDKFAYKLFSLVALTFIVLAAIELVMKFTPQPDDKKQ